VDEVTNALIAGISAKVKTLAQDAELRLNTVAESAAEQIGEAVSNLAQAGHLAAEQAARRASRLTAWPTVALTLLLSAGALCAAFVGGVYYGTSDRTVEKGANSPLTAWALTPAGYDAYALDKANAATGGIRMFTLCSLPGWRTLESHHQTLCMPYPLDADEAKYEAWILPRDPRPIPPKRH
jgi:hypothetical protein